MRPIPIDQLNDSKLKTNFRWMTAVWVIPFANAIQWGHQNRIEKREWNTDIERIFVFCVMDIPHTIVDPKPSHRHRPSMTRTSTHAAPIDTPAAPCILWFFNDRFRVHNFPQPVKSNRLTKRNNAYGPISHHFNSILSMRISLVRQYTIRIILYVMCVQYMVRHWVTIVHASLRAIIVL